ncbi:hypothetical protein X729_24880 [Mesorhizobium sp. L103C131B0]|nr:hypothetical protein X729_24880 [Mesorhizobium sp. L103C131B0]
MLVATDWTSKFDYAQLPATADKITIAEFLRDLVAAVS